MARANRPKLALMAGPLRDWTLADAARARPAREPCVRARSPGSLDGRPDRRREAHSRSAAVERSSWELAIDGENPPSASPCHHPDCWSTHWAASRSEPVLSSFGSGRAGSLVAPSSIYESSASGSRRSSTRSRQQAGYTSTARRCRNVRSVCADATSFPIPEHPRVLYFNNPFAERVFARDASIAGLKFPSCA
jgi:hypothetical protein